jgi:phage-related protein
MATLADLEDVLNSVDTSIRNQTVILQDIFNTQQSILQSREREEERNRAERTDTSGGGAGGNDEGGPGNRRRDRDTRVDENGGGSLLSAIFGGTFLADIATKFITPIFSQIKNITSILFNIRKLFKTLLVGGGLVLLYEIFKDIGENPEFQTAIETIKKVWNESIVPLFNRIKDAVMSFISTDEVQGAIVNLSEWFERLRINIQDFVGNTLEEISKSIGSVFDGINQMLDRDFIGGIKTILTGVVTSIINIFDSALTNFLEIFGVDFGEDGSFLGFVNRKWDETMDSISEFWNNMIENIKSGFSAFVDFFDPLVNAVSSAISVIQDLFSFGEEDKNALGLLGKLTDLVYAPVNMAINFVKGLFGFEETEEPFKLQDWISEKANAIFSWLGVKFSEFADYILTIPEKISIEAQSMWIDVKEKLKLGFLDLADWLMSIPKKMLAMVMNVIGAVKFELPKILGGGTISLVDQEDVDAANAAASAPNAGVQERRAEIIADAFIERGILEDRLSKIEERALEGQTTVAVNYAPVDARQTQINQKGGDSQTAINSFGGSSRNELSYGSVPGGMQPF